MGIEYVCEWCCYVEPDTNIERFRREWRKIGARGRYDLWVRNDRPR